MIYIKIHYYKEKKNVSETTLKSFCPNYRLKCIQKLQKGLDYANIEIENHEKILLLCKG
jgi:hypothetical protein